MNEMVEGDKPRNKRSRCPYCCVELSVRYVKAHIAKRHLHYEELPEVPLPNRDQLPIEVPLPNRDQSADPIHEEIESKFDELPAGENQESKNYEDRDANFRDESRIAFLQVDSVIGHRHGPDGSFEFQIQWVGGAVSWRPGANITSPGGRVLVRRYQIENHLLDIEPRNALFHDGDPLLDEFDRWASFGHDAVPVRTYPACKVLFEC